MLEGSILQKLAANHQDAEIPLNLGVYYKNTLVALCHALEDFVLESVYPPLIVTAFQQGKWYLEEADRYGDLAQKASQIAIMASPDTGFAEHPTSQAENVHLISLGEDDPVAQEWHLIICSPAYTAMVLCQELSPQDYGGTTPDADLERKFYGFWTFEPELVQETIKLAINHVRTYNPELASQLNLQLDQMAKVTAAPDDVSRVVERVMKYLQTSGQNLSHRHPDASAHACAFLNENLASNKLQALLRMAQLVDQADIANSQAGPEVATLCEAMGQFLDLPAWQIKRLRLAALLHRLGSSQGLFRAPVKLSPVQQEALSVSDESPKAPILRVMPQLQAVANIVSHQQENWDGSGKPDGLSHDAIPLESRILGLVAFFQRQLTLQSQENEPSVASILEKCRELEGQAFDPKLVEALELLGMAMQQGMDITVQRPKMASGIWLFEPETASPQTVS
ncbi:MAG: DICT sensory domain-containing protein [Cyanobacteria bacterium P01_H01_bin.15]